MHQKVHIGLTILESVPIIAVVGRHEPGAPIVVEGTHGRHSLLLRTQDAVFEPLLGVTEGIHTPIQAGNSRFGGGGVHPARVVFDLTEFRFTRYLDDVRHIRGTELGVMSFTLWGHQPMAS